VSDVPAGLVLFVGAALVLLVTPGPAVLYIVTRSVDQGRRAGLVSVLGVHLGTLVHIAAAAAGLSALLATSAAAFSVVKYLGAAYLVYLDVRRLLAPTPVATRGTHDERGRRRALVDGIVAAQWLRGTIGDSWRASGGSRGPCTSGSAWPRA
jgi:threonine/homoserine/homoserine lactone efflux protein